LMAGGGANAVLPDGSVLMVVGPSPDVSERSLVLFHEMAHEPVHRILQSPSATAALDSSACAYATVEQTYGYPTWRSYFAETLVRGLAYRLEGMKAPVPDPFPFLNQLIESLERWEGESLPFEEA